MLLVSMHHKQILQGEFHCSVTQKQNHIFFLGCSVWQKQPQPTVCLVTYHLRLDNILYVYA